MKKFLVFLIIAAGAYFAYDNFLKEKELIEVKGNLVKIKEGANIDAPAIQPRTWGHIEGTAKNVSENVLNNIEIVYKINGRESVAKIRSLGAGEEIKFKTENVMLNSYETTHFLEKVNFENQ